MSLEAKNTAISLDGVSKIFRYAKRQGIRGLLRPEPRQIVAVDDISLNVGCGESVAFIGPNGAGKSTTIKMLCGILQPSSGTVSVLGLRPLAERRRLALRIGTVFGQRSQLLFNLPLIDSLKLTAEMYLIPKHIIQSRIGEVVAQFGLEEFVEQPVRKLSLGQRMRAEIANSLLHKPDIIFLDEPTIGLDVVAKRSLREVIRETNKRYGTTIFLTSHDSGDIQEVCDRTVVVTHGRIALDVPTKKLQQSYLGAKRVRVLPKDRRRRLPAVLGVAADITDDGVATFLVDTRTQAMPPFLAALFDAVEVADMTIEDRPLEDIIHELYMQKTV